MKLVTVCFKLQSFVRANTEFDVSMFFVGTFAMKVVQFTAYWNINGSGFFFPQKKIGGADLISNGMNWPLWWLILKVRWSGTHRVIIEILVEMETTSICVSLVSIDSYQEMWISLDYSRLCYTINNDRIWLRWNNGRNSFKIHAKLYSKCPIILRAAGLNHRQNWR